MNQQSPASPEDPLDEPEVRTDVHGRVSTEAELGSDATIRAGTIVYDDVSIGDGLTTGHHALIRDGSTIGDDVTVGTHVVIDGDVTIGSNVSLQTGAYVPPGTVIGDDVFVGPYAILTNDRYPVRVDEELAGPVLEDGVSVGANATLLPEVAIGERSFVAAGAVVATDVPPETLAIGVPAEIRDLPEPLRQWNQI